MTKKEFANLTYDFFDALHQPRPDNDLLREWFALLESVELALLKKAYDALIDLKAKPTLDAVLSFVNPSKKIEIVKPLAFPMKYDGRDWARKILNKPEGRPIIAINHANFALGLAA